MSGLAIDRAIVIDLETTGLLDLRKVGAQCYARDKDTDVLCWSYICLNRNADSRWARNLFEWVCQEHGPMDRMTNVENLIDAGCLLIAHNVAFERAIWQHILTPRYGWPECPGLSRWRDTMAMASYYGLPASLAEAGAALGLAAQKDMTGHRLMMKMARPRSKKPGQPVTWWHRDEPGLLADLKAYCYADVEAEMELFLRLPMLPAREQAIWEMDQKINDRGVGLDVELVNEMITLAEQTTSDLDQAVHKLTNGTVRTTREVAKLLAWLKDRGYPGDDLAKPTVEKALAGKLGPLTGHNVENVLRIRQQASKSSVSKLKTMLAWAGDGTVLRGLLQYYGAMRTGRWAGRGPQPQNYPRPDYTLDVDLAIHMLKQGVKKSRAIPLFLGLDVMTVLSGCLRGCLTVPEPDQDILVAADYSQIEARVIAWMANQEDVLQAFRDGEDVYTLTAEKLGSDDRQFGKLMVLSCGFQTGGPKLRVTAEDAFGIVLTEAEAVEAVAAWRETNPAIVQLWYDLNTAAITAVQRPGRWIAGAFNCVDGADLVQFRQENGNLHLRLPSRRMLCYRDATIVVNKFGRDAVSFMGINQYTRKWERQQGYGGMWCNNSVQGTARDFMAEAMLNLRPKHKSRPLAVPVLSVHDELLCAARKPFAKRALKHLIKTMETPVPWAPSVPLAVDGYIADRFKKG